MKVLALVEGTQHVCYRYRIEAFAEAMAERGWTLQARSIAVSTFKRTAVLREAAGVDVVILQRRLLPLWQLKVLRSSARRLVFDFDDAVFHRDSYSRKSSKSCTRLARFWATIYASDAVLAGNPYLQQQAACYIESDRVHYFPTCVDTALYSIAEHSRADGASMIWIGQRSTLPSLRLAEPCLAAAAAATPNVDLRVVCNHFPQLDGIRVIERPWSQEGEATELAAADIGISWLPDDPWSQGKCGLKVLQYMAAGLPVVANPVAMNAQMVEHGRTGFLASTPGEWSRAVAALARDPKLRRQMGAAARRVVEERYSVQAWRERFVNRIERVALEDRDAVLAGRFTAPAPDGATRTAA